MGNAEQLPAPHWQDWAAKLDASDALARSLTGPRPVPPVETRPTEFSVTEIETLIRDPYAIYAKHVLDLRPLDMIDADVTAAERGTIIHKALEEFSRAHPDKMPADALGELLRIGRTVFASTMDRPAVATFWWPRFERLAEWFIEFEQKYRSTMAKSFAEQSGRIRIDGLTRETYLRGRADRMDMMEDGRLTIIDYKTGGTPSQKEVETGLSPQLPLEAAMAKRGAFETFGKVETAAMLFIRLTGAEQKPGEVREIPVDDLPEKTWHSLVSLLLKYENPKTPYLSNPRPQFVGRFADYDHLARVKEWSAGGEGGE
jgi:ATP-dependent helicase/nuclease subunit B